jgi:hypothetical protein
MTETEIIVLAGHSRNEKGPRTEIPTPGGELCPGIPMMEKTTS